MQAIATIKDNDEGEKTTDVIVKFAESYGVDTHTFMAKKNVSPPILYFGSIQPNWKVIVMEKWDLYPFEYYEATYQVLNESIADFHKAGFVHGDLREANVKLRGGGKESIALIDFDWAGKIGIAKYPL